MARHPQRLHQNVVVPLNVSGVAILIFGPKCPHKDKPEYQKLAKPNREKFMQQRDKKSKGKRGWMRNGEPNFKQF